VDAYRVRDVVGCRTEFDCQDEFVDDLGALFADDMRPSNSSVSAFVTSLVNPSVSLSAFGLLWSAKS